MKNNFEAIILITLSFLSNELIAQNAINIPYGSGEHFPFNDEVWGGNDEVVTKIKKDNATYTFVRVSKYLFEVRAQKEETETLFRLDLLADGTHLAPFDTKLVDVYREDGSVSALLYAHQGYFLVTSTRSKPVLGKGQFMLWLKNNKVEGWNLASNAWRLDFFPVGKVGDFPDSRVGSIKLIGLNKIECTSVDDKKQNPSIHTFSIEGDKLFREGVVMCSIPNEKIHDEEELVKFWNEIQDPQLVTIVLQLANSKDEFLKMILENNRDKKNYDALKARLDKAFENHK